METRRTNLQIVTNLIQQVSGQKNILSVPRIFLKLTGDVVTGLFLSQCIWWSDKGSSEDGWFWKSNKEWDEEIGLSYSQVKRAAAKLKEMGILKIKIKKAMGAPTTHYFVDMETLTKSILNFLENQENKETEIEESRRTMDFEESQKSLTAPTTAPTSLPQSGETNELINKRADTRSETDLPMGEAQASVLFAGRMDAGGLPPERVAETQHLLEVQWGSLRGKDIKTACVYLLLATGWDLPPPGARKRWDQELRQHVTELAFPVRDLPGYYATAWQRLQNGKGRNGQPLTLRPYPGTLTATMEAIREERKRNAQQQQKVEWEWK